jgi:glycosyltransferase involved in cell wall biosynthesis
VTEPITIVIPTYNRAAVVTRAIRSALAQDDPVEVVVVDDGSTDDTPGVVRAIPDPRLQYVHVDNGGHTRARNAGARAASGELLAFLDDDDELDPSWAGAMRAPFADDTVMLVCCGALEIRHDATTRATLPRDLGPAYDGVRGRFDTGAYVVRRALFDAAGGFADGLPSNPHNEFAFRLLDVLAETHAGAGAVVAVDRALVTVNQARPEDRSRNQPRRLYDGALYIVEHHRERLARDPQRLADHYAVAAVCAARLDDFGDARRLLRAAVRVHPRVKHVARYALACVPPVARRVWHTRDWAS